MRGNRHTAKAQMALLSGTFLVLAACGGADVPESGRRDQARPIVPFDVEMVSNTRVIQAVGTARAKAATLVTPETAGIVNAVLFTPGTYVEKGDPLIALEADDEDLAVRLAQVSVREAEQLLARYRRIENTGAVSDSAIDEAKTRLEAARINLEQAELRLAERTVRAPFSGFVGLTDIDPGARISQTTSIAPLDDRETLYVDFPVPEDAFSALKVGSVVNAQPFAEDQSTLQAQVVHIDSRIDARSRAFTARAAIDNRDDRLRPGMSFDISFTVPGMVYPLVPEAAIVWGSNGAYVWAIEAGRTTQKPVNIISRQEGKVLVDADLTAGATIVAEGVQKVREGTQVTLLEAAPPMESSGASGALR